jgi:hypothetical protein
MRSPISATEADLFRACTKISVGDGTKTKFWHDRWLDGSAPRDAAPALIKFAWRKNISVATGLDGTKWMKDLLIISTAQEFNQFVTLWIKLQHVQLTSQPDQITWRFSPSRHYSVKSVYQIQFAGSFPDFHWAELEIKGGTHANFFTGSLYKIKFGRLIGYLGMGAPQTTYALFATQSLKLHYT